MVRQVTAMHAARESDSTPGTAHDVFKRPRIDDDRSSVWACAELACASDGTVDRSAPGTVDSGS